MQSEFEEEVKTIGDYVPPLSGHKGSFGLPCKEGFFSWYTCREDFAQLWTGQQDICFSVHNNRSENVAAFIRKTEEILNVVEDFAYTKFYKTIKPYGLWIKPSDFWLEHSIKRSLFTILLRCGVNFYAERITYEDALQSDVYAVETKQAILRFLSGHTDVEACWPNGWRNAFAVSSDEEIRKTLVWSKKAKAPASEIGAGLIWN